MNSGFFPKVVLPSGFKKQTKSGEFQTPFFFGGSQVPMGLALPEPIYNGSKGTGFHKGIKMDKVSFHKDGHFMTKQQKLPFMK
jgi:hypothetical protein